MKKIMFLLLLSILCLSGFTQEPSKQENTPQYFYCRSQAYRPVLQTKYTLLSILAKPEAAYGGLKNCVMKKETR